MASFSFLSSVRFSRKLSLMRSFHSQRRELKSTKSYLVPIAVGTGTLFAGYQYIYKEQWNIAKPEDDINQLDLQVMSSISSTA